MIEEHDSDSERCPRRDEWRRARKGLGKNKKSGYLLLVARSTKIRRHSCMCMFVRGAFFCFSKNSITLSSRSTPRTRCERIPLQGFPPHHSSSFDYSSSCLYSPCWNPILGGCWHLWKKVPLGGDPKMTRTTTTRTVREVSAVLVRFFPWRRRLSSNHHHNILVTRRIIMTHRFRRQRPCFRTKCLLLVRARCLRTDNNCRPLRGRSCLVTTIVPTF